MYVWCETISCNRFYFVVILKKGTSTCQRQWCLIGASSIHDKHVIKPSLWMFCIRSLFFLLLYISFPSRLSIPYNPLSLSKQYDLMAPLPSSSSSPPFCDRNGMFRRRPVYISGVNRRRILGLLPRT